MDRLDALLSKVAVDGGVDYETACRDPGLRLALEGIAAVDLAELPDRDHRVAFLINAYNTAALGLACKAMRSKRFRRKGLGGMWTKFRFFFLRTIKVAGRRTTLAWLECVTLRRQSRDPRIHTALVCATGSCPPLKGGKYHGDQLDRELDLAAHAFVRGGAYRYDSATNTLHLNRIFKWYAKDFQSVGGVRAFVAKYAEDDDKDAIRTAAQLRYDTYDWKLNDRSTERGQSEDVTT